MQITPHSIKRILTVLSKETQLNCSIDIMLILLLMRSINFVWKMYAIRAEIISIFILVVVVVLFYCFAFSQIRIQFNANWIINSSDCFERHEENVKKKKWNKLIKKSFYSNTWNVITLWKIKHSNDGKTILFCCCVELSDWNGLPNCQTMFTLIDIHNIESDRIQVLK